MRVQKCGLFGRIQTGRENYNHLNQTLRYGISVYFKIHYDSFHYTVDSSDSYCTRLFIESSSRSIDNYFIISIQYSEIVCLIIVNHCHSIDHF